MIVLRRTQQNIDGEEHVMMEDVTPMPPSGADTTPKASEAAESTTASGEQP